MTTTKIIRNVYCTDPEDRVIRWRCVLCAQCWLYVASRNGGKNGRCVYGGPFDGWERQ